MFSQIHSFGIEGINGYKVLVECDIQKRALPAFDIVGLPDLSVKESRNRVRSALQNTGFSWPDAKITINLAPADIRKEGSIYDLPILIAILKANQILYSDLDTSAFLGELSLSGEIRAISGILPMVLEAKDRGFKNIFIPYENGKEVEIISGIDIYPVKNISELYNHLTEKEEIPPLLYKEFTPGHNNEVLDFADVKGQDFAKRALEIAAAGGHNALMIGPPGSGKSMLAKRLPSILPDMTFEEAIETTKIYSVSEHINKNNPLINTRPFRSPHHSSSSVSLSGGGAFPKPGEISLAHNGVLFLDELPEFQRSVLEVLRQPMEDREITISRTKMSATFPCSVMVIGAMNPCPCGYYGHPTKKCICSDKQVARYLSKISGPLLDRMDLHIEVSSVNFEDLSSKTREESSEEIKKRVNKARQIQYNRYKKYDSTYNNANAPSNILNKELNLEDDAQQLLKKAFDNMGLSARAYDKIVKVARTIADLDSSENIKKSHIAEAIQYRSLDRKYWGKSQ